MSYIQSRIVKEKKKQKEKKKKKRRRRKRKKKRNDMCTFRSVQFPGALAPLGRF